MAVYYVSQTATNGYAVGASGNNGTAKATPKLTIQQANALATHGDTIYVNDGTYAENSGAGYLDITNGISLLPETDYGVTLTTTSPVYNVLRVAAATTRTITIGKIILDSDAQATSAGLFINTSAGTININGTKIVTGSNYGIRESSVDGDITIDGAIIYTTGNLNSPAIYSGLTKKSGTVTVKNSTFNLLTNQNSYTGVTFLPLRESPTTWIFTENTMTISTTGATPSQYFGVRFWGCQNWTAQNNTITLNSTDNAGSGACIVADKYVRTVGAGGMTSSGTAVSVALNNHSLEDQDSIIVTGATQADYNGVFTITRVDANNFTYTALNAPAASPATGTPQFTENFLADGNIITGNNLTFNSIAGYCIRVGTEADDAGKSTIVNTQIYSNTLNAPNAVTTHALLYGSNLNGRIWGNYVSTSNLGLVIKNDIGSLVSGNVMKDCTNNAIYLKGATNSVAVNNTIIQTIAQGSGLSALNSSASTERNSTGVTFANNLVFSSLASGILFAQNGTTSTGDTWTKNNYYTMGTIPNNAFLSGASYLDLAGWISGKEATATNIKPSFVTSGSGANAYKLLPSTALYELGKLIFQTRDFRGRPFHNPPTIGAFEFTAGDSVQTRTVATTRSTATTRQTATTRLTA